MNSHKNARLTRLGRVHTMEQIANIGLQTAAGQAGISARRARMWPLTIIHAWGSV